MKSWTKIVLCVMGAAVLSFGIFTLSCAKTEVRGNAATVYAETKSQIMSEETLKAVEALQNSFRAISNALLPSVVEVDTTETRTVNAIDPFEDIRRFFFGNPGSEEGNNRKQRKYESKGLGSGVIVRRTGDVIYVLTNNHVAGEATKISVKLNDGREFEAKLVGADSRMDIALVSFESKDSEIPVAVLGDSDEVQTGDICFAMGAPLGFSQSVTQGIVSAKGRSGSGIGNINDFIQTDAAINQGNSGGRLLISMERLLELTHGLQVSLAARKGLDFPSRLII